MKKNWDEGVEEWSSTIEICFLLNQIKINYIIK